ncbi:ead/Ea22-like family protein [Salmonella enterica]|nr:ead/Ea22-like family protein [Salmonella enterica]EDU1726209.1 ead/Ea22-like family protein [Salmonella enterica subsp. enterica serovar Javiana]EBF9378278.1 ead/Ea22-like family protein [Salmonella enterica]EDZ2462845.1 ead/Ea22-like family protein [Salmonella enterica]EHA7749907.1 ead/Ea22-like family protein [Salmonella enterica]
MTIDKQALREAAEKAGKDKWQAKKINGDFYVIRSGSYIKQCGITSFQPIAEIDHKPVRDFVAMVNPATTLALLDENLQLQREKDAIEAVALALRDDMRQAREQLEAAEKRNAEQREYYDGVIADGSNRIAELEKGHQEAAKQINSWRRLAKQNIAERGKDISELEAARQRIAELEARAVNLPKRSVDEVMHLSGFSRDYAEGWCAGNDNAIHEIRAAGIKVKES